jgi:hypothetical protein
MGVFRHIEPFSGRKRGILCFWLSSASVTKHARESRYIRIIDVFPKKVEDLRSRGRTRFPPRMFGEKRGQFFELANQQLLELRKAGHCN